MNNNQETLSHFLRVRPPFADEDLYLETTAFKCLKTGTEIIPHSFSQTYGPQCGQEQLFNEVLRPHIDKLINGENISVLVTGPHHSGKSYTMFGPGLQCTTSEEHYGLLPRAGSYLFSKLGSGCTYRMGCFITLSLYEIQNSSCFDLLGSGSQCYLSMDQQGIMHVKGGLEMACSSPAEVMTAIQQAMNLRSFYQNHHTSSVFARLQLTVPSLRDPHGSVTYTANFILLAHFDVEFNMQLFSGDIWLLDALAVTGGGLVQLCDTDLLRSLLMFHLLKDSFSNKLKTVVIFCLSPSEQDFLQTKKYLTSASLITILKSVQTETTENVTPMTWSMFQDNSMWQSSQEFDNESVNAQSHGLTLERIEEVTESEEEIASSDDLVSLEEDNSCESDQEVNMEVTQYPDEDFNDHLNNLCQKFNCFVDSFVESFKSKTTDTPSKEHKLTNPNVRRGAMHHSTWLPLQNHANINLNKSDHVERDVNRSGTQSEEHRPTTCSENKNVPDDSVGEKLKMECSRLKQLLQAWNKKLADGVNESNAEDMTEFLISLSFTIDELLNYVEVTDNCAADDQDKVHFKHQARKYRMVKEAFQSKKYGLSQRIKDQVASEKDMRDYLIADEVIELVDHAMEYLNNIAKGKKHPGIKFPNTQIGTQAMKEINMLSVNQLRYMISHLFMKVVDLRQSSKALEMNVAQLELKDYTNTQKIYHLNVAMQRMRSEGHGGHGTAAGGEIVSVHPAATSPSHTLALPNLPGRDHHRERGLQAIIPQQNLNKLQVKEEPPNRVLRNNKKLIVEVGRKRN